MLNYLKGTGWCANFLPFKTNTLISARTSAERRAPENYPGGGPREGRRDSGAERRQDPRGHGGHHIQRDEGGQLVADRRVRAPAPPARNVAPQSA